MSGKSTFGSFGFILLVAVIWLGIVVHNQNNKIDQLKSIIDDCDSSVTDANQNISDLNDQIENAQGDAWSDYDTMGQTLGDLTTSDQVDNPCYDSSN